MSSLYRKFKTTQEPAPALIEAVKRNDAEIVKVLLRRGIDVNATDKDGNTALLWASSAPVARLLIDNGTDLEKRNSLGNTALMLAAAGGWSDIVSLLIDKGADLYKRNNHGNTAWDWALNRDHPEIAQTLVEAAKRQEAESGSKADKIRPYPKRTLKP